MPALGITGGIGTGKTAFSEALGKYLPMEFFDADRCAHELLDGDKAVQEAVAAEFGDEVLGSAGIPDRLQLRRIVFASEPKRRALEAILHPRIRARWTALAETARHSECWLCADIPLLYETNAESSFCAVVVVGCSAATQRLRLIEKRHLSLETVEKIIAAQQSLAAKIAQADYVIWNDSSLSSLDRQSRIFVDALQRRHGRTGSGERR